MIFHIMILANNHVLTLPTGKMFQFLARIIAHWTEA